jgi:hypothetical protein
MKAWVNIFGGRDCIKNQHIHLVPFEANWQFFQQVQRATEAQGRQFILTTTNKAALEKLFGKTEAIELLGKPEDLNEIVTAVKKKLQT